MASIRISNDRLNTLQKVIDFYVIDMTVAQLLDFSNNEYAIFRKYDSEEKLHRNRPTWKIITHGIARNPGLK